MNRRTLIAALVFAVLLIAAVALSYIAQFGGQQSTDQEIWGQFGDYFAGLLNPPFSLIAFLALMYSLVLQREEAQRNQARFESQHTIAMKELEDYAKEKLASELLAVLKDIDQRLDVVRKTVVSPTGAATQLTVALMVAEGNRLRASGASSPSYSSFVGIASESGTVVEAAVRDMATLVAEMKDVLEQFSQYRGTAQAPLIVYYANKTYQMLTALEDVGAVDHTTREFFATVSDKHH
jgi:uncharacterized membrane protein